MFKIGDKVERTTCNARGISVGDIAIISEIEGEKIFLEKHTGAYNSKYFILVDKNETKESMLTRRLNTICDGDKANQLKRYEERIENIKYEINRYIDYIKDYCKQEKDLMMQSIALKSKPDVVSLSDIEALLNHKSVCDVKVDINNKTMTIFTDYIDIYDEKGNKFKGNKYELDFNFDNMKCKIFGADSDYCRRSYWTKEDPHPHVNGDTGEACWGDAGPMLTMNMNNYEIYASFIVVLNFLQQVNTNDAAGRHICNWDCVNEKGEDIDNPYENIYDECPNCESEYNTEDGIYCNDCGDTVCNGCSVWLEVNQEYICTSCYEDGDYFYCEYCGDRGHNDSSYKLNDCYYCESCYDNKTEECCMCENRFDRDEITKEDGKNYCEDCYSEAFVTCDECNDSVKKENIFYCDTCNKNLCTDCEEEMIPGMCKSCYEKEETEASEVL